MHNFCRTGAVSALVLGLVLGLCGCTTVITETAKMAKEDRSSDDHFTDSKIGTNLLAALADRDKNLLLDVSADVWEQRVMLTGTVADAKTRKEVEQLAAADKRVKKIYNEIQVVSVAELARRRDATKNKSSAGKEGVDRALNDFWIETKISARLVASSEVASVNFRWRSVRNTVYLIGRAQNNAELKACQAIIRTTEGVAQLKSFVEIKPLTKN